MLSKCLHMGNDIITPCKVLQNLSTGDYADGNIETCFTCKAVTSQAEDWQSYAEKIKMEVPRGGSILLRDLSSRMLLYYH